MKPDNLAADEKYSKPPAERSGRARLSKGLKETMLSSIYRMQAILIILTVWTLVAVAHVLGACTEPLCPTEGTERYEGLKPPIRVRRSYL